MWPIGSSRYSLKSNYKAFGSLQMKIGPPLKKEKKEKKKDNQYKLKKAMAITIGLIIHMKG